MSYRENIRRVFNDVPEGVRREGIAWYAEAHECAAMWSRVYEIPLPKVVGALSALSPGLAWEVNLALTEQLCKLVAGWRADLSVDVPEEALARGYRTNATKAWRIIIGSKETPHRVATFFGKTAPKTRAFYWNILCPETSKAVTVDRHAYAIAKGWAVSQPTKFSRKEYNAIARAYRAEARKAGLLPSQLQAMTWTHHRDHYNKPLPF